MHQKLRSAIILLAILPILISLPACSKNTTATGKPEVSVQEDTAAKKVREQLERERQEREAKDREFRAQKIKFMYEDILFDKGSYKLLPDAKAILVRKAQWLQKNPNIKVVVEGHTDEAGTKEYNFVLGDQRAGAVKSFLIGQGIQSARLIAVSYGNEQPIDHSRTAEAQTKNRRVHFVVEE